MLTVSRNWVSNRSIQDHTTIKNESYGSNHHSTGIGKGLEKSNLEGMKWKKTPKDDQGDLARGKNSSGNKEADDRKGMGWVISRE